MRDECWVVIQVLISKMNAGLYLWGIGLIFELPTQFFGQLYDESLFSMIGCSS